MQYVNGVTEADLRLREVRTGAPRRSGQEVGGRRRAGRPGDGDQPALVLGRAGFMINTDAVKVAPAAVEAMSAAQPTWGGGQ